jgi:hypothetical protein
MSDNTFNFNPRQSFNFNQRQYLLAQVLEQIKRDVRDEDMTAILELVAQLPTEALEHYLPE